MNKSTQDLLIRILNRIDEIKNLAFRVAMHDASIEPERWMMDFLFYRMPRPAEMPESSDLSGLAVVLDEYLALVPDKYKVYLLGFQQEEYTSKNYNEIDLFEAGHFVRKLHELLSALEGRYEVVPYALNDMLGIRFASRKEAVEFAKAYGGAVTIQGLPVDSGGRAEEVACF